MTEIGFYVNVPDRAAYACRLVRKALRQRAAVAVTGTRESLGELDRALWSFDAAEFVPHNWIEQSSAVPQSLRAATVWLAPVPLEAPVHGILVNLGDEPPHGFETYARLLELVADDEAARVAARERWRGYARRGYAISKHEAATP